MFRYVRLSTLPLLTLTYQFSVLSMNVWVRATGTIVIRRILNTRKGLEGDPGLAWSSLIKLLGY